MTNNNHKMNTIMNTIMNSTISVLNSLSHINLSETCYTMYNNILNILYLDNLFEGRYMNIFTQIFTFMSVTTFIYVSISMMMSFFKISSTQNETESEDETVADNNVQNMLELENIGRVLKAKYSKQEEIVRIYRDLIEKLLEERGTLNDDNRLFLNQCDEMLEKHKSCLGQYDENIKTVLEKTQDLVNEIDIINQTYDSTFIKDKKYVDENIKKINILISEKETLESLNDNLKHQCDEYHEDKKKLEKKKSENRTIFLYRKKNSGTKVHTKPDCVFLKNQIDRIYAICHKDLGYYIDNECVCAHCNDDYISRYVTMYSTKTNNSKNSVHLSCDCQHLKDKEVKKTEYDYSNYLLMSDFDLICTTCQNTKETDFKDKLNV